MRWTASVTIDVEVEVSADSEDAAVTAVGQTLSDLVDLVDMAPAFPDDAVAWATGGTASAPREVRR